MHPSTILSALFFASLTTFSSAFRATPSQQCANSCGGFTSTDPDEIVCSNDDMDNTTKGQALKKCLDCQLNSTAADPNTGENDVRWLLYNSRYILSSCLWDNPNTSYSLQSNPCVTSLACGSYQQDIQFNNLSASTSAYDYCTGYSALASLQQPRCQACLSQLDQDSYLQNLFIITVAGCSQKPNPGTALSLQGGTIFSTRALNITNPQPTSAPIPNPNHLSGPLSLGAVVGVSLAAITLLLISSACLIICLGKRRRRRQIEKRKRRFGNDDGSRGWGARAPLGGFSAVEPKWASHHNGGGKDMASTPGGESTLSITNSMNIPTPISAHTTGTPVNNSSTFSPDEVAFSPYTSQLASPVSALDMINMRQANWPSNSNTLRRMPSSGQGNHLVPASAGGLLGSGRDGGPVPGSAASLKSMKNLDWVSSPYALAPASGNSGGKGVPSSAMSTRSMKGLDWASSPFAINSAGGTGGTKKAPGSLALLKEKTAEEKAERERLRQARWEERKVRDLKVMRGLERAREQEDGGGGGDAGGEAPNERQFPREFPPPPPGPPPAMGLTIPQNGSGSAPGVPRMVMPTPTTGPFVRRGF